MTSPGSNGRATSGWALLGPAFVASIAYVDPGNVAANLSAGSTYGYALVWVLAAASGMAMLIQYQSAKLGLVTGATLPQLMHAKLEGKPWRAPVSVGYGVQAFVIAVATDVAEVVGGALALHLMFGTPLWLGGIIVGLVSVLLLWALRTRGERTFELAIGAILAIISAGFLGALFWAPPDWRQTVGGLIPGVPDDDAWPLIAAMLGATVMPHAIYLHSTLVNDHYAGGEKPSIKTQLRGSKIDVAWALLLAGTVNLAMLVLAANSLHGMSGTDSIDGAQRAITQVLGPVIGTIFSIGLLASSLSSTSVGTYAGSEIMHGLLHVNAPMWACRVVTLVPALIVLWFAKDPTQALVIGQVVLSIGIPFAVIPLMRYTHDKELMGKWADGTVKHVIFMIVVALIVALNVLLIVLTLMGRA